MADGLIDDEVRRSFPGWSDEDIRQIYDAAKAAEVETPQIFESDLSHARIIRELGWVAFKEYLCCVTGSDDVAFTGDDYIALTDAVSFLRELENTSLYAAIYGASSEASSKKTVSARKESYKSLTAQLHNIEIAKGI